MLVSSLDRDFLISLMLNLSILLPIPKLAYLAAYHLISLQRHTISLDSTVKYATHPINFSSEISSFRY